MQLILLPMIPRHNPGETHGDFESDPVNAAEGVEVGLRPWA
jgi:hypothetical protein